MNVYHFQHDIAGRPYNIEVTPVGNRWRAQLRRTAGMPTALMPFYGPTPEEAAACLTRWLSLAHAGQTKPVTRTVAASPGRELVAGGAPVRYD